MPFTPAHTVIAKPLSRLMPGVPVAAIVAGSVAPDLEFFWHLEAHRTIGHLWPGVITLSLPLGALALVAWHFAFRPGIRVLLPEPIKHLVQPDRFRGSDVMPSAIGLVIGVASHIMWDWFTHPNNPGPKLFGYSNAVAGGLQILSGLVGLGLLALWLVPAASELRRHPISTWFTDEQKALWRRGIAIGAAIGSVVLGLAAIGSNKHGVAALLVWMYLSTGYAAAAGLLSTRLPLPAATRRSV